MTVEIHLKGYGTITPAGVSLIELLFTVAELMDEPNIELRQIECGWNPQGERYLVGGQHGP